MLLTLTCFGEFQITWEGNPLAFATHVSRALLAYLAVNAGQTHSREKLAALFWPDQPQATAFANLRSALARLRKALPASPDVTDVLLVNANGIQFRHSVAVTDVNDFEAALTECKSHPHTHAVRCTECAQRLTHAIALYTGELLQDLSLRASQPFEEWLLLKREQLRRQMLNACEMLSAYHEQRGDYAVLCHVARRHLELEPWHEPAHRQLMRALALNGDRSAALMQYEACQRVLALELQVEPESETHALAERIRAGELSSAAPAPRPSPHNLPAHLTSFVGRENELSEITARLRQPGVRLLSLVGGGGMGKTRLAVETARARLGEFPDGVFFVSLTSLDEAASIVPAIAAALGLSLNDSDSHLALLHALREKHLLLILDNFEHVLDGASLVVELLRTAPQVQCLITSRERLNVQGEHLYEVLGMEYGSQNALTSSAVRLFAQSARRVQPAFTLSDANLPDVLRVCQLVAGMPLGLELAAAWVEAMPLGDIAAEIERNADFLAYAWRGAPERQHSLRAVFDWSWALLTEAEQKAYRQLSVFRGGFTRDAAQVVANASLRVLTNLVHKSLLRMVQGRYEIHELLRQFTAQKLEAQLGESDATDDRHSQFYLAFVTARESRLKLNQQREATAEIMIELDNVRRAWVRAVGQAQVQALQSSAFGLWDFFCLTGLFAEGEQAFGAAAVRLKISATDPAAQRLLSKMLALQAHCINLQGQYDRAIPIAQQAVTWGETSGDTVGEAMGYLRWGQALWRKGRCTDGRPHFERALALALQLQNSQIDHDAASDLEWDAWVWLGGVYACQSEYAQASWHLTNALRICQRLGNRRGECRCLLDMGEIAMATGDYATATQHFWDALTLAREQGNRWYEGSAQLQSGIAALATGDFFEAGERISAAAHIFHEIGDTALEGWTLAWHGYLADALGDAALARNLLSAALRLGQSGGSWEAQFFGNLFLALLCLHLVDYDNARRYAEHSLQIVLDVGDRSRQADAWQMLARAYEGLFQLNDAANGYSQALALYAELGQTHLMLEPRAGLARIALARDDLPSALSHVEDILPRLNLQPGIGLSEPFLVYATCIRVLQAKADLRIEDVLRKMQMRLHEVASHIQDDALRQSYLSRHLALTTESV